MLGARVEKALKQPPSSPTIFVREPAACSLAPLPASSC